MSGPISDPFYPAAEFPEVFNALMERDYPRAIDGLREAFNLLLEARRYDDSLALHEAVVSGLPPEAAAGEIRLWSLLGLGNAQRSLGDLVAAHTSFDELRAAAVGRGDSYLESVALERLAALARSQERIDAAVDWYRKALAAKLQARDVFGLIEVSLALVSLYENTGRLGDAEQLLNAAEKSLHQVRPGSETHKATPEERHAEYGETYNRWEIGIRFHRASILRRRKDYQGAIRLGRQALRMAQTLGERLSEAKLLQNLANDLVAAGKAKRALPLYQHALRIAESNSFHETARAVQLGHAIALFRLKRYSDSISLLATLQAAAAEDQDRRAWAVVTAEAGAVHVGAGDVGRGATLLKEALSFFRASEDTAWQQRILRNLVIANAQGNDIASLETHIHEYLSLLQSEDYKERHAFFRFVANLYLNKIQDADGGARYFRQAVEEAYAGKNAAEAAQTALLAAASLSNLGAFQGALFLFDRATELFTAIADMFGLWRARNDRGIALVRQGQYEEAIEEFGWCLRQAQERQDRAQESQALLNLGETERRAGRLEEALLHTERALELYRAMADQVGELDALNALGLCHVEEQRRGDAARREADEARPYFEAALSLARRLKNRSGEAMAARGLARVAELRVEISDALRLYELAADIWEREQDFSHCAEALAARVALGMLQPNARRLARDTNRLFAVVRKGGVVGTAARGLIAAAGNLIHAGQFRVAADIAFMAFNLNRFQSSYARPTQDADSVFEESQNVLYDLTEYIVGLMEGVMTPEQRDLFFDRMTRPENFEDPDGREVLRRNFQMVRDAVLAPERSFDGIDE